MGRNTQCSFPTPTNAPSLLLPFLVPQQEEMGCKSLGGGRWCSWEFGAPCRAVCSTEERGTRLVSNIALHHWVIFLCFVFGSSWLRLADFGKAVYISHGCFCWHCLRVGTVIVSSWAPLDSGTDNKKQKVLKAKVGLHHLKTFQLQWLSGDS